MTSSRPFNLKDNKIKDDRWREKTETKTNPVFYTSSQTIKHTADV